jgi:hypothetical protein
LCNMRGRYRLCPWPLCCLAPTLPYQRREQAIFAVNGLMAGLQGLGKNLYINFKYEWAYGDIYRRFPNIKDDLTRQACKSAS